MTHPLTYEIIDQIAQYDPNLEDMRAAADWQLDKCIEELNQLLYVFELAGAIANKADRAALLDVFKKAMRPQGES